MKHFLKLSFILFAAILLTSTCEEPEYDMYGSVFGMITNSKTNEVVSGAQVVLAPGNITAVTGADGNYEFQELEPGQFRLTVSADGYESYTRQITVVVGERIICDVQLTPLEQISDMELSTDRLDFGTSRTELTFNINNIGTAGDLSWTITNITVPWLSVTPDEGTTEQGKSSSVKVVIDRDIIKSDVTTSFNVEAAGGSKSVSVSVVYDDGSYNESDMVISEKELDFGTEYDELSFYVRNTGASETLVWSIDEVTADWLTVSPTSGNTAAGKSTSVRVTVNRSLLTKDADAVIIVKAENGASESVKVTVKYDGSNEKPDLDLSVNELDFGHDLNQMSFEVLSVGTTGTLEWSVTEISVPWLSVSPTSGSTPAGSKESVVVTIDRTQITKDENTVFTVSADGVSESVNVSVDYAIDENLSMELSESILDFGTSESELSFNIMNTAQTLDLNWKITGIKEWMTVTPSEGVTEAGRYTTVSITVDRSKVQADETAILMVEADGITEALVVKIEYVAGGDGSEDVTSGLYVYYKFEDDFNDASGNAIHGFGSNNPEFTDGVQSGSKAVRFQRTQNSYMTVPSPIIDSRNMTISFWAKDLGDGNIFYMVSSNNNEPMFSLSMSNGSLKYVVTRYDVRIDFDYMTSFSHINLNDGNWHHIVLTSDFNQIKYATITTTLYVDGQKMDVVTEEANPFSEDGSDQSSYGTGIKFVMGGEVKISSNKTLSGANMVIDNFRVYDTKILSDSEIKRIYNFER